LKFKSVTHNFKHGGPQLYKHNLYCKHIANHIEHFKLLIIGEEMQIDQQFCAVSLSCFHIK